MLFLLLIAPLWAASFDACTDLYSYACKQPNKSLSDGTGSINPQQLNLKLKIELQQNFTKFTAAIKSNAAKDPIWGQMIAEQFNSINGVQCDSTLSCADSLPVKQVFATIFTNEDLGYDPTGSVTIGQNDLDLSALNVPFFQDMAESLREDARTKAYGKADPESLQSIYRSAKEVVNAFIQEKVPSKADQTRLTNSINETELATYTPTLDLLHEENHIDAYYPAEKKIYLDSHLGSKETLFGVAFVMAHELAHTMDPCSATVFAPHFNPQTPSDKPFAFPELVACLRNKNGGSAQTFSDWQSTQGPQDPIFSPHSINEQNLDFKNLKTCCQGPSCSMDTIGMLGTFESMSSQRFSELKQNCPRFDSFGMDGITAPEDVVQCSQNDQIGETFSDWVAFENIPAILKKLTDTKFTPEQFKNGMANSMRGMCGADGGRTKFEQHPRTEQRFRVLMANPTLRESMGCEKTSPTQYCDPAWLKDGAPSQGVVK